MYTMLYWLKKPVKALINAAGLASMNMALTTDESTVQKLIQTNLVGTIYCCQLFAPIMLRRKQRSFINFSTIAVALASKACKKVLVLCGETNSKLINEKDKSVSMIFGDAGSATVLGFNPNIDSFFNFHTDGSGYDDIIIPDGGARNGFSANSLTLSEFESGNRRHALNMKMDGISVFNFAINSVTSLVRESLSSCSLSTESIDLFAAHQANQLIVRQIAKKCGFTGNQSPFLAFNTGNTGPASIPLLLSEGFANQSSELKRVLMCGFGVGLTWGVCITNLSNANVYPTSIMAE